MIIWQNVICERKPEIGPAGLMWPPTNNHIL